MFEIIILINLVGLAFIYNINRKINKMYYVVDVRDDFVLYTGNLYNCEQVIQENYAGLQIASYKNLTKTMKLQLQKEKK
jgi:hypothetical protein